MLLDRLAALGTPHAVAGGDLNERPNGRTFKRLATELQDGWATAPWGAEYTSTPADPHQRIDAIFATEGVEVLGCGVPLGHPGVTEADLRRHGPPAGPGGPRVPPPTGRRPGQGEGPPSGGPARLVRSYA